eukprot:2876_1
MSADDINEFQQQLLHKKKKRRKVQHTSIISTGYGYITLLNRLYCKLNEDKQKIKAYNDHLTSITQPQLIRMANNKTKWINFRQISEAIRTKPTLLILYIQSQLPTMTLKDATTRNKYCCKLDNEYNLILNGIWMTQTKHIRKILNQYIY